MLFCRLYFHGQSLYMVSAALAGLVGHIWPLYYRFHGGSGYSAILGGLLVIDPLAVLVAPLAGLVLGIALSGVLYLTVGLAGASEQSLHLDLLRISTGRGRFVRRRDGRDVSCGLGVATAARTLRCVNADGRRRAPTTCHHNG